MDHHQQHHHGLQPADDIAQNYFYSDPETPYNVYNTHAMPYQQVVHHDNPQTRQLAVNEIQQQGMAYMPLITQQYQSSNLYPAASPPPPHVGLPLSHSPPPPSPELYDPLSPPVSGSDTSGEGLYNSSANTSPTSSRANSLVHRTPRYNPTPSPTSSLEDEAVDVHETRTKTKAWAPQAEQRRRDELRDGYARLKEVLPISNQKSNKVSLLERATNHIVHLETTNRELQARLAHLEQEMTRLRSLNEKISLPSSSETPSPGVFDGRPISPPPDAPLSSHSLQDAKDVLPPPRLSGSGRSSPSASDSGYC
ncbi:hypothetical protein D9758_000516 [Tetrapyrgos nigripes]|uniref:BHLH domain-containing protein n=1 Tax=Tetrapyrgos nigripes TaxID=182062 RepID=A0A8H5H212_9AGAR|nr:hypothetical protein D9758_000516 [Tetrapyrgos nigripes]